MNHRLITALLVASTFQFSACSGESGQGSATTATNTASTSTSSKKTMPEDPDLKSLYVQSCFSCHGTGAGGAPRTGTAEWDSRMAKGMDTLLDNTINGFNGMPPLGLCMDCGEEEFEALIRFMAGEK